MMIKTAASIFFISTMMLLFSCKKENEIVKPDVTVRYLPNKAGTYIDYQVDSLYYNLFSSTVDTFTYQIREEIAELYTDAEGRKVQRLQRYKKVNGQWLLTRVYTAFAGRRRVERTEENITYIKLIFPLMKDSSWNANAMNTLGTQYYTCVGINQALKFHQLSFDSCASISQKLDSTLITKHEEKEVYAAGVGLVYKRSINLEDRASVIDPTIPISKRANNGTDVRMYAIDFGVK
jgi:hypothetical protein